MFGHYTEIKKKQELLDQRKQLRQVADSSGGLESDRESAKRKLELIEAQTKGRGSIPGLVEAEETTNLYLGNLAVEVRVLSVTGCCMMIGNTYRQRKSPCVNFLANMGQ